MADPSVGYVTIQDAERYFQQAAASHDLRHMKERYLAAVQECVGPNVAFMQVGDMIFMDFETSKLDLTGVAERLDEHMRHTDPRYAAALPFGEIDMLVEEYRLTFPNVAISQLVELAKVRRAIPTDVSFGTADSNAQEYLAAKEKFDQMKAHTAKVERLMASQRWANDRRLFEDVLLRWVEKPKSWRDRWMNEKGAGDVILFCGIPAAELEAEYIKRNSVRYQPPGDFEWVPAEEGACEPYAVDIEIKMDVGLDVAAAQAQRELLIAINDGKMPNIADLMWATASFDDIRFVGEPIADPIKDRIEAEAAAMMQGIPCPDCLKTPGKYVGLSVIEDCTRCGGTSRISPIKIERPSGIEPQFGLVRHRAKRGTDYRIPGDPPVANND